MQNLLAPKNKSVSLEIPVGANECRLAHQGERLVARAILADVVVTIQVPADKFAAMLRFSVPVEKRISRLRLEAVWEFADQALTLLFENMRSMDIASENMVVSVLGGADVAGLTYGRGRQLSQAVTKSLQRQGAILNANDLGGKHGRGVWLESASGRLIVRTSSPHIADRPSMPFFGELQRTKAS